MNNNENDNNIDNGFTNVSSSDTSMTGMESNLINLTDNPSTGMDNNVNNKIKDNGGFPATDNRSVESSAGKHGGFVINNLEEDNSNDINPTIDIVNENNTKNQNENNTPTPQPQVRKVVRKVTKKTNNNKKLIEIIIGLVIFIVLLIIIFFVFLKKPATAQSQLPKKTSQYYKICSREEESAEVPGAVMEMAVGVYELSGVTKTDIVIVWKAKNGKLKARTTEEQEEVVSAFASYTGLAISLGGEVSNKNNYFKDGRVFITNTREYSTSDYANTNELLSDLQSIGMKCK